MDNFPVDNPEIESCKKTPPLLNRKSEYNLKENGELSKINEGTGKLLLTLLRVKLQ